MNIVVQQSTGGWGLLAAEDNGDGTVSLATTMSAPNSSLTFEQATGQFVKLATVLSGGVHTLAVASDGASASGTTEDWFVAYEAMLGGWGPLPPVTV